MVFVFQVSRLGKYVNWIRKQTKDKGLARRIKQLLKTWQKLANSATTQNGLQVKTRDTSVQRSVSPTEVHPVLPTVSSASLLSVPTSASLPSSITQISSTATLPSPPTTTADGIGSQAVTGSKSDAVFNRLKKRSLFSAIKKSESPQPPTASPIPPPTTATATNSTSSNRSLLSTTSAPLFTTAGFSQPILPLKTALLHSLSC